MIKYITIGIVALAIAIPLYAGYDIQNTALPEPSALYNHLNNNLTESNLVQDVLLYHSEGVADKVLSDGTTQQAVTAAGATDDIAYLTSEIVVNGVFKYVNATAEINAYKSLGTLAAGKRVRILIQHNGSAFSLVEGTEYDATTEAAIIPAVTAGYVPVGYIQIINTDAAFTYGTTNFNAAGVTTTDEDLYYVFEGTSKMNDLSLSNQ